MDLSLYLSAQETEVCCAEPEIHEQGCQAQAASRDSQAAGGAGVEQDRASVTENSSCSLHKPLSNQGHSSQPSVCGEKRHPVCSFTFDRNIKDDDDDDDDSNVCFHGTRRLMLLVFT